MSKKLKCCKEKWQSSARPMCDAIEACASAWGSGLKIRILEWKLHNYEDIRENVDEFFNRLSRVRVLSLNFKFYECALKFDQNGTDVLKNKKFRVIYRLSCRLWFRKTLKIINEILVAIYLQILVLIEPRPGFVEVQKVGVSEKPVGGCEGELRAGRSGAGIWWMFLEVLRLEDVTAGMQLLEETFLWNASDNKGLRCCLASFAD